MASTQRTRPPQRGSTRGGRGVTNVPRGSHTGPSTSNTPTEKPKRDNIVDLSRYMDKSISVSFAGGREVTGILKGFDQLMNLVLDDVREKLRDEEGNESTRRLGLVVCRGTLLTLISPTDGSAEIPNPFAEFTGDGEGEEE